MFYTVIHKSGWQTDTWRIGKTWNTRQSADDYAKSKQSAAPRDSWYHIKIVAHRKPVSAYRKDDSYRFTGGIVAVA